MQENLLLLEEVEKFSNMQEFLMRADNREEESNTSEVKHNNDSKISKTTIFLSNFRKGFLHQSTSKDGRKKIHKEMLLDSSLELSEY